MKPECLTEVDRLRSWFDAVLHVRIVAALIFGALVGIGSSLLVFESVMNSAEALSVCKHFIEAAAE